MTLYVRSAGVSASFREGAWELGQTRGSALILIGDEQVVGRRSKAISWPTFGATIDSELRAIINSILEALRGQGLIEM